MIMVVRQRSVYLAEGEVRRLAMDFVGILVVYKAI
jgi:hypothetical protein